MCKGSDSKEEGPFVWSAEVGSSLYVSGFGIGGSVDMASRLVVVVGQSVHDFSDSDCCFRWVYYFDKQRRFDQPTDEANNLNVGEM